MLLVNCSPPQQRREDLHKAIRAGDMDELVAILSHPDGSKLARAKNYYGNLNIVTIRHIFIFIINFKILSYE